MKPMKAHDVFREQTSRVQQSTQGKRLEEENRRAGTNAIIKEFEVMFYT